jgi:hypothetical protein
LLSDATDVATIGILGWRFSVSFFNSVDPMVMSENR